MKKKHITQGQRCKAVPIHIHALLNFRGVRMHVQDQMQLPLFLKGSAWHGTYSGPQPALNTVSAVCIDVYSYCMLSKSANWSPSVRAAYCTWTRGDRFFCLLATPAYNVIHTTELNGDTNVQYNHINRDDDNTKGKTWMLRTCRERKKREGEKKKWRRRLMFNGRSKYYPLFLFFFYSKQCGHP